MMEFKQILNLFITDEVYRTEGENRLDCPFCGQTYLHQDSIVEYNRRDEDGFTRISAMNIETAGGIPENPSPRRDAVSIHFWCENCDNKPKLNIIQHKGQTFVSWDRNKK